MLHPLAAEEPNIVVCVHGFLRTHRNMAPIEKALKKEGWTVINWSYPSRDKRIQEHAEDLALVLAEIAEAHPGKPIHFVTHSLGGLIVRAALNVPHCPEEAKQGRAVLIAPPNQGAAYARALSRLGFFRKLMGLASGQELMTEESFAHIGTFPETKEVLVIAGNLGFNPLIKESNDGKVGLSETHLVTPHDFCTVAAGHSWITWSPTVIKIAKNYLKNMSALREGQIGKPCSQETNKQLELQ